MPEQEVGSDGAVRDYKVFCPFYGDFVFIQRPSSVVSTCAGCAGKLQEVNVEKGQIVNCETGWDIIIDLHLGQE